MKCKICGDEINLTIHGLPNGVCWGCLSSEQKSEVVESNIKKSQYRTSTKDWVVEKREHKSANFKKINWKKNN